MPQRDSDPSILDVWLDHPGATLAAAAAGAAACAVTAQYFLADLTFADDEAPIRVRNGSPLEIELLHVSQKFQEADCSKNRKRWRIKGAPQRGRPEYVVIALPGNPASLPNGYIATGRVLKISYEGGHDVRFEAHGRKTVIDAPDDLVQDKTKHELLRGSGAITKVMVDTTKLYERQGSKESLQMFVLDLLL